MFGAIPGTSCWSSLNRRARSARAPIIDAEVASIKLDSLGGGLELLTDEQRDYLSGWQEGT
jgi:S-adenosylhomocysteine hydrolase